MYDLNTVFAACCGKLDALAIPYGKIVSVTVNTRAHSRWGQCRKNGITYSINISSRLMAGDVPLTSLEDTVIHEILHTCPDCMNHGRQWKMYAEKVNRAYGYNVTRTSSAEEKGVAEEVAAPTAKHKFVCMGCNGVIVRTRESKFTRNYRNYYCGKCGGAFRKEF